MPHRAPPKPSPLPFSTHPPMLPCSEMVVHPHFCLLTVVTVILPQYPALSDAAYGFPICLALTLDWRFTIKIHPTEACLISGYNDWHNIIFFIFLVLERALEYSSFRVFKLLSSKLASSSRARAWAHHWIRNFLLPQKVGHTIFAASKLWIWWKYFKMFAKSTVSKLQKP